MTEILIRDPTAQALDELHVMERLDNGGEVIMRRSLTSRSGAMEAEIVLCRLPHNRGTPYVTWQRNIVDRGCYWGHYFTADKAAEAISDYRTRGIG